jgi:hypothetical protein
MDAPLPAPDALVRPWRTATLVASLVAAVELVLLLVAAVLLLAKPLSHAMQRHAEAAAFKAPKHAAPVVKHVKQHVAAPKLTRDQTSVWVLNGNGRSGAASAEASKLSAVGYRIRGKSNATRADYATTVVMYRRGYQGDGARLARDMKIKVVGPLDGLKPAALHGAQVVVLLGAR